MLPRSRCHLVLCAALLASSLEAGPGLLVRDAERYYRAPVRRTIHPPSSLPSSPPDELLLPFQEEDLFELKEAGYLADYQGPEWDREGACTRLEAVYLLGGLVAETRRVYGDILPARRTGQRSSQAPRRGWGEERLRLAMAADLVDPHPSQLAWWDEPPDRFQAASWIERALMALSPRIPVLLDPKPYEAAHDGVLAYYGHPMRRRVRRILRSRVMRAPRGAFRGREPLGAREWVRILNRLRLVLHGYRRHDQAETGS